MKCDILTQAEWLELNDHLAQSIAIEEGELVYLADMNIDNDEYDNVYTYGRYGWIMEDFKKYIHIWDAISHESGKHCGDVYIQDYYRDDEDYYPQQVLCEFVESVKHIAQFYEDKICPLMFLLLPDLNETKKLTELPEGVYVISCAKAAWD